MNNESTLPRSKSLFHVIQSGPWDPATFGVVEVEVRESQDGLEAVIDSRTEPQIRFRIDAYELKGDVLFLRTNAARRWIFRALN